MNRKNFLKSLLVLPAAVLAGAIAAKKAESAPLVTDACPPYNAPPMGESDVWLTSKRSDAKPPPTITLSGESLPPGDTTYFYSDNIHPSRETVLRSHREFAESLKNNPIPLIVTRPGYCVWSGDVWFHGRLSERESRAIAVPCSDGNEWWFITDPDNPRRLTRWQKVQWKATLMGVGDAAKS
jgi:hypothetical protein